MRVHVVFFIIGWVNTRLRAHICLPSKSWWEHRPVSKRGWWLHGGLDVMWTVVMFLVISFKSYWIQHPSIDPLSSTYPKQQAKEDIHDALLPSSAEQSLVAPKAWSHQQVLGLLQSLLPIVVCSRNRSFQHNGVVLLLAPTGRPRSSACQPASKTGKLISGTWIHSFALSVIF